MSSLDQEAIAKLDGEFGNNTIGLVQAVADRLFLSGERPTRARVYGLIQRGSYTTIDKALRQWWGRLREKTQAGIKVPGVPDELTEPFQVGVKGLWDAAYAAAKVSFDEDRQVALAAQQASEAEAAEAVQREREALSTLRTTRAELAAANERGQALERAQSALEAERAAQDQQLAGLRDDLEQAQAAQAASNAEHERQVSDLQKERVRAREVLQGQLDFATQRIEEAREKARSLQADLERERARSGRIEQEARDAAEKHQATMTDVAAEHVKKLEAARAEAVAARQRAEQTEAAASFAAQRADADLERARAEAHALDTTLQATQQRLDVALAALTSLAKDREQARETGDRQEDRQDPTDVDRAQASDGA